MVDVLWLSLHEDEGISPDRYWDQEWLRSIMAGEVWKTPALPEFVHYSGTFAALPPETRGAIVVIPARWHVNDVDAINEGLARLGWAMIVLTGDEESVFPWQRLNLRPPRTRVWVQTPRPELHGNVDGVIGDWWPPRCREILKKRGYEEQRPIGWFYSGQVNNLQRQRCHAALDALLGRRGDGIVKITREFGSGLAYEVFLEGLATSKVAPCPSGTFSPDSFRVFEALEAGSIPIVDHGNDAAPAGYWNFVFGGAPPFPIIDDWNDVERVIDDAITDWPRLSNQISAWWLAQKRSTTLRFVGQLRELAGLPSRPDDLADLVTVLIPTSPIPSHPSTEIIEETIASVRERLPDSEIVVMVDGVREEQKDRTRDYREFTRRLLWKAHHEWRNVSVVVHEGHLHQAVMTKRALEAVTTPTILFVEHDTPLVGEIPFDRVAAAVLSGEVNVVRFHHESEILDVHKHLMLDNAAVFVEGSPLMRTVQYSQRPHLADSHFYRWMVNTHFSDDSRTMIEDVMYGAVSAAWKEQGVAGWRKFKLALYAPDGDVKRSTHTDGRGEDPKYEMRFAYDGDVPPGAPNSVRDEMARVSRPLDRAYRLGVFGARGDRRGLAIQLTEVSRHLNPDKVLGIDMDKLSPHANDWSDYDQDKLSVFHHEEISKHMIREWLSDLDCVFGAETFYKEWFTGIAREMGIKTVLQFNPEFSAHVKDWLPMPDVMLAPSSWMVNLVPQALLLPLPVDRERLKFRERTEAKTFLHVIGHAAANDRQGTKVLWEALRHVEEPTRVLVRSQRALAIPRGFPRHVEIEVRAEDEPSYWKMYDDGDVLIHPRRYGGQSMPANEALSCGLPVLMSDAPPQNEWLPSEMLVPLSGHRAFNSLVGPLPLYDVHPQALAIRMDQLSRDPEKVRALSSQANELAKSLSWETLKPRYEQLFLGLVGS